MSQLSDILKLIKQNNGIIHIDKDGDVTYFVKQLTKENFEDMPDLLYKQLQKEGNYGYYVSGMFPSSEYLAVHYLPIFGSGEKYITRHLCSDIEECIQNDLKTRDLNLYKRIMEFEKNKDDID